MLQISGVVCFFYICRKFYAVLKHLKISNYALISNTIVDFDKGFTVITGETGAGKSILLGALSLLLGQRADASVLRETDKKCTVEGHFDIADYHLNDFFSQNDIDYFDRCIVRREIAENGRSRAFVNDSPVNLTTLRDLTVQLVDIHSQHKNIELSNPFFQLTTLDNYAGIISETEAIRNEYKTYSATRNQLKITKEKAQAALAEEDYIRFIYTELTEAKLKPDEQESLEQEAELLEHAEEIKLQFALSLKLLADDEHGSLILLRQAQQALSRISKFWNKGDELAQRIESVRIEAEDIFSEIEKANEQIEFDPKRSETVSERLNKIYHLQKKHGLDSIFALAELQKKLKLKLDEFESFDEAIKTLEVKLDEQRRQLEVLCNKLSEARKKHIPNFEHKISELLRELGMPAAVFKVEIRQTEEFTPNGTDIVSYLFSANKNLPPQEIGKIASGGEISRLMLSLKSVIADSVALPTIVFDEIDTGISGEIADKTAGIMKRMSKSMQVVDITHLPQVASKADTHLFVYKDFDGKHTESRIRILNAQERINEIAAMLSGAEITDAALAQAKALLGV